MDWVRIYAIIFIAALFFSLIYTPLCKRLAQKFHFLDVPKCEQHKLHRKATPLLGGLAMFAAWLTTILGALAARCLFPNLADSRIIEQADGFFLVSRETFVLLFCAGLSTLLGVYDDKFSMKAWKKLIGQILIAMIAATWGGLTITLFIGIPIVTWCVTVFWIVLIFNAINFFDNMDVMNSRGITVFLDAAQDVLFRRLKQAAANRPLVAGKSDDELRQTISEGLERRMPFYSKAAIRLDGSRLESRKQIEDTVETLRNLIIKNS